MFLHLEIYTFRKIRKDRNVCISWIVRLSFVIDHYINYGKGRRLILIRTMKEKKRIKQQKKKKKKEEVRKERRKRNEKKEEQKKGQERKGKEWRKLKKLLLEENFFLGQHLMVVLKIDDRTTTKKRVWDILAVLCFRRIIEKFEEVRILCVRWIYICNIIQNVRLDPKSKGLKLVPMSLSVKNIYFIERNVNKRRNFFLSWCSKIFMV